MSQPRKEYLSQHITPHPQGRHSAPDCVFCLSFFVHQTRTAIFLQKFAVVVGGFFAGGYLLIELLKVLSVSTGDYHWLVFIAGGLVGAVLMSVVFGWTLIILSSLIGSILIVRAFPSGQQWSDFLFIGIAILGIIIQSGLIRKGSPPPQH